MDYIILLYITNPQFIDFRMLLGFHTSKLLGEYSLAVQWLGLQASTARGQGSVPGRGTKIPQASQCGQNNNNNNNLGENIFVHGHLCTFLGYSTVQLFINNWKQNC